MMIKRIFAILSCILCLYTIAFAVDPDDQQISDSDSLQDELQIDIEAIPSEDLSQDLILNDSVSGKEVIGMLISKLGESKAPVVDGETFTLTDVQIRSLSPVQPSGDGSLKDVMLSFVGDYDPVVVEYAYQSSQGYTSYLREIQPDYAWMISVAVLIVFIYCLFRLGGSLLCRR